MTTRMLQFFVNLRFKQKLILSYVIITFTPVLILGAYSYQQSSVFIQKQAIQGMKDTVNTMADNLSYMTRKYNELTNPIVFNTGIQRIIANEYTDLTNLSYDLREHVDPLFNMILYLNKEITKLTIYTKTDIPEYGNFIQSHERVKHTAWYRESGQTIYPEWHYEQGDLVLTRKFPHYYTNHQYVLLSMKFRMDGLFQHHNIDMQDYGIVVTDSSNNTIYTKQTKDMQLLNTAQLAASEVNGGITKANGVRYFVVKSEIKEAAWTIYYYLPVQQVSVSVGNIVGATVIIILLCMVVLFTLIWLFSNTLLKQILELNKKMNLVAHGNLDIDIHIHSQDEIGELAARFSTMLQRINELIKEGYQTKLKQKEAELNALQNQINPHFLYNTLSIINWKAMHIGATDISRITKTLSRFYRTTLNKGEHLTRISNEIENIRSYADIQLIVHDYSFDVEYAIDDKLYEAYMLNFILQPVVENAIGHGIERKLEGRGRIHIAAAWEQGEILINVKDNGPGMNDAMRQEVLINPSKGYGLRNVNERIKLYYGDQYGITIESVEGVGTNVSIRLPVQSQANVIHSHPQN